MKKVSVTKDDLVAFARRVYSKALNGYADLEDSVCISEASKFYESLDQVNGISVLPSLSVDDNHWTFSTSLYSNSSNVLSSYTLNCNPNYSYTVSAESCGFSSPFSNDIPPDRQLLLFRDLDSNNSIDNEFLGDDSLDGDLFSPGLDSNEGHVFY